RANQFATLEQNLTAVYENFTKGLDAGTLKELQIINPFLERSLVLRSELVIAMREKWTPEALNATLYETLREILATVMPTKKMAPKQQQQQQYKKVEESTYDPYSLEVYENDTLVDKIGLFLYKQMRAGDAEAGRI